MWLQCSANTHTRQDTLQGNLAEGVLIAYHIDYYSQAAAMLLLSEPVPMVLSQGDRQ